MCIASGTLILGRKVKVGLPKPIESKATVAPAAGGSGAVGPVPLDGGAPTDAKATAATVDLNMPPGGVTAGAKHEADAPEPEAETEPGPEAAPSRRPYRVTAVGVKLGAKRHGLIDSGVW
jgi:hypothetical protein